MPRLSTNSNRESNRLRRSDSSYLSRGPPGVFRRRTKAASPAWSSRDAGHVLARATRSRVKRSSWGGSSALPCWIRIFSRRTSASPTIHTPALCISCSPPIFCREIKANSRTPWDAAVASYNPPHSLAHSLQPHGQQSATLFIARPSGARERLVPVSLRSGTRRAVSARAQGRKNGTRGFFDVWACYAPRDSLLMRRVSRAALFHRHRQFTPTNSWRLPPASACVWKAGGVRYLAFQLARSAGGERWRKIKTGQALAFFQNERHD